MYSFEMKGVETGQLAEEGPTEEDPWKKAYVHPEPPPAAPPMAASNMSETTFVKQPKQAIIVVGPTGTGRRPLP